MVPIVHKQSGAMVLFGALMSTVLFAASLKLIAIIANKTLSDRIVLLTQNAAKSGAGLINTEGEATATATTNDILVNYDHTVTISDCAPYSCLTVTVNYQKLFSNDTASYTVTAASYSDPNKVGAFLVP